MGSLAQVHDVRCEEGDDPLKTIDRVVLAVNNYSAAGGVMGDAEAAAVLIRAIPKDFHPFPE